MISIKGKVVGVQDYFEVKVGKNSRADYCPITLKCDNGEFVQLFANTKTLLDKTYMVDKATGKIIQVGMIKPNIGDMLEVEGTAYKSYDGIHSKHIKYIQRITRTVNTIQVTTLI